MDDRRLMEEIDACRPGTNDAKASSQLTSRLDADPRARRLYERVQEIDGKLLVLFQDVPVPEGLADRLLAALKPSPESAAAVPEAAPQPGTVGIAPRGRRLLIDRRRWLAATAALAASILVALTAWWLIVPRPIDPQQLMALAGKWNKDLPERWQPIAALPTMFAMPRSVLAVPRGWQDVSSAVGRRAVALDLSRPGRSATLFAIAMHMPRLPSAPPVVPQSSTGGQTIAAWQRGGVLYVLVVGGDEREYRTLVDATQGPLA